MLTNFTRVQTFGSPNVHSDRLSLDDLTSFAAVAFAPDVAYPAGLETRELPGGLHAVLHFTGPCAGLPAASHWLYGDWLAASSASLRDALSWEFYLDNPADVAPADLRTDIYLPLA